MCSVVLWHCRILRAAAHWRLHALTYKEATTRCFLFCAFTAARQWCRHLSAVCTGKLTVCMWLFPRVSALVNVWYFFVKNIFSAFAGDFCRKNRLNTPVLQLCGQKHRQLPCANCVIVVQYTSKSVCMHFCRHKYNPKNSVFLQGNNENITQPATIGKHFR